MIMITFESMGEENTLALLVKSPDVLFAYWQLSSRYLNIFAKTLGMSSGIKLVARLYRLNDKGKEAFLQLENVEKKGCRYFRKLERGYAYQLLLGFYRKHKFTLLLQSAAVAVPAGGVPLKKVTEIPKGKSLQEYSFS